MSPPASQRLAGPSARGPKTNARLRRPPGRRRNAAASSLQQLGGHPLGLLIRKPLLTPPNTWRTRPGARPSERRPHG
eukprot:11157171-Lingulodinium_polyedra.AAC.1